MIKQLGGTRGVPKPNAAVAGEALNLLTFLGGNNKAGAKLLAEMKEVQSHNGKILDEANAAINEANKLQKEVVRSQDKVERRIAESLAFDENRQADIEKRNLALNHKKSVDDEYFKSQNASLGDRKASVDKMDKEFVVREKVLAKANKDVAAREKIVAEAEVRASRVRRELEQRDARVRQAMGG